MEEKLLELENEIMEDNAITFNYTLQKYGYCRCCHTMPAALFSYKKEDLFEGFTLDTGRIISIEKSDYCIDCDQLEPNQKKKMKRQYYTDLYGLLTNDLCDDIINTIFKYMDIQK